MSTTAYLCPEHGLIQRVLIPFGAEDPMKFCSIENCDARVAGPIEVVPRSELDKVSEALKRVMRNQARLLEAWALGTRFDEDSDITGELAESRDQAKDALGYPKMEHR